MADMGFKDDPCEKTETDSDDREAWCAILDQRYPTDRAAGHSAASGLYFCEANRRNYTAE